MCPGFAEPRTRLERASTYEFVKFCDDTPAATMLSTLSNSQDLDPDCSAASFLVQWTQAHWNADIIGLSDSMVWTVCRRCVLRSRCSSYGELLAINVVWVRSHSILAPGCTTSNFETTETITLCEKCFLPFSSRSADSSLTWHNEFRPVYPVSEIVLVLLYFEWKLSKLVRHCQIQCNFGDIYDLCKLGKEYLTALTCKLRISF